MPTDPTLPPDTLLVDGTDLSTLTGVVLEPDAWGGLFAPATRRGSHRTEPGRQGQVGVELPLDAWQFTVPVALLATSGATTAARRGSTIANHAALIAACLGTKGLVALTRRTSTLSGTADVYAAGAFDGVQNFTFEDLETIRCDLQFTNLSGAWTPTLADVDDPTATSWVVP